MARKQKAFDVTVDFCGFEAETEEEAKEMARQMLREAFALLPTLTVRTPWIVTHAEELH